MAIGLTVAMDIMALGPLTGAAMNPARAFGPALAGGRVGRASGCTGWGRCWAARWAPGLQHGLLMRARPVGRHGRAAAGPPPAEERGTV
jgi:hypothetical protein